MSRRCLICSNINPCRAHSGAAQEAEFDRNSREVRRIQSARKDAAIEGGERFKWAGEGPEPARWTASDGTVVYRSYEDYCDD